MGYFVKNKTAHRSPDGIVIPNGVVADRPLAPAEGTLRYNTEYFQFEYWNGAQYMLIGTQTEFLINPTSVLLQMVIIFSLIYHLML